MRIAITGGTGFVGRRLIAVAVGAGHEVTALTRRSQFPRESVTWVDGALDDRGALVTLTEGADVVIHVAGVVNAPDRAGFAAGNVEGTRAILGAAHASGVARLVHVSSLAAREPGLSDYGWSKAEAEQLVRASPLAWMIVRPPAVYGPGDLEMRDMFRIARLGLAFLPPPGRMSAIHVDDLARLLLVLAERGEGGTSYEPDDGHHRTHAEFGSAIGRAVGRKVLAMHLPAPLLRLGAWIDGRLRGSGAKLTPDRVGYLIHPDWAATPMLRPPSALWQPQVALAEGLAQTAAWYRAQGLL
jgi:nucleoside-diphosphate-sugar epimerase